MVRGEGHTATALKMSGDELRFQSDEFISQGHSNVHGRRRTDRWFAVQDSLVAVLDARCKQ